jgi:hypothetical protein
MFSFEDLTKEELILLIRALPAFELPQGELVEQAIRRRAVAELEAALAAEQQAAADMVRAEARVEQAQADRNRDLAYFKERALAAVVAYGKARAETVRKQSVVMMLGAGLANEQ